MGWVTRNGQNYVLILVLMDNQNTVKKVNNKWYHLS